MPPSTAPETRTPEQAVEDRLSMVPMYSSVELIRAIDTLVLDFNRSKGELKQRVTAALTAYIDVASKPKSRRGDADLIVLKATAEDCVREYNVKVFSFSTEFLKVLRSEENRVVDSVLEKAGLQSVAGLKQKIEARLRTIESPVGPSVTGYLQLHKALLRDELLGVQEDVHLSTETEHKLPDTLIPEECTLDEVATLNTVKNDGAAFGKTVHETTLQVIREYLIAEEIQGREREATETLARDATNRVQTELKDFLNHAFEDPTHVNGYHAQLVDALTDAVMDLMGKRTERDHVRMLIGNFGDFSPSRLAELAEIESRLRQYNEVPELSKESKSRRAQLELEKKEVVFLMLREYFRELSREFELRAHSTGLDQVATRQILEYFEREASVQIDIKRNNDFGQLVRFRVGDLLKRLKLRPARPPREPWSRRRKIGLTGGFLVAGLAATGVYEYTSGGRDFESDMVDLGSAAGNFADWLGESVQTLVPEASEPEPEGSEVVVAPAVEATKAPEGPVSTMQWGALAQGQYPEASLYGADIRWLQGLAQQSGVSAENANTLPAIAVHCESGVNASTNTVRALEFNLPAGMPLNADGTLPWVVFGQQVAGFKPLSRTVEDICKALGTGDAAVALEKL